MMESWIKGELTTNHKDEKWQLAIWRKLNQVWYQSKRTKGIPRRSQAYSALLTWFDNPDHEIWNQIPNQLYIFGLSQNPRPFLEIIAKISSEKEVHFLTKSVPDYNSNPELQSLSDRWAKPAKEQLNLLKSILNNAKLPFQERTLSSQQSNSIPEMYIHSCHNNRREVEVLKDQILHYLDTHTEAKASDVLVMVPDAEEYAGILETVFKEEGPVLPVSQLSGRGYQSAEQTIAELLSLLGSKFKASSVLEFLNLELVKSKFKLSDGHLDLIEDWVLANKVHHSLGDDFNQQYSWQKGLNQLVSGFMLQPDSLELYKGLVPFDEMASSEDAEITAHFSQFIYALQQSKKESETKRTPPEWLKFTEKLVDTFVGNATDRGTSSAGIKKLLDKLQQQISYTEYHQKVDFNLIKDWLSGQLSSTNSSSGRFGQGVTVSSYIPYRSVPFRFIAMLGANESVFPRKAVRPEFDIIYANPRPGDRIMKDDDSYLFLETLQAAREHIHLSYKGLDQRSDSERLPSILIQQLPDGIDDEKNGIIRHSLHPFNSAYFDGSSLNSYSDADRNIAQKLLLESDDKPILFTNDQWRAQSFEELNNISISDLIKFFSHPSKHMLQNVLNIKNYNSFNEVIDREQFKLKGLERYKLDDYLFDSIAKNQPIEQVFDYAVAAALIPEKLQGQKSFQAEKKSVTQLHDSLKDLTEADEREEEIRISIGDIEFYGFIGGIYDDVLVSHRVGKRRAQHEVIHWLQHLLLLMNDTEISKSVFISKDKGDIEILEIETANITENPLPDYIDWFLKEDQMLKKTAFFPESSKAFTEELMKEGDDESAKSKARSSWEITNFNKYGESSDFFNALMWRGYDPIESGVFQDNSTRFWEPYFRAINGRDK
jgi:exodeoxyribonuclease V gamma subunit